MENEIYSIIYDIKEENNTIRIMGEQFMRNNKNKGKIIFNNKKYPLRELFELENKINNKMKIKMILSKNCCNKSFMFKDCVSLIQIQLLDNLYDKNNILFEDKNVEYIEINSNKENKDYQKFNLKISSMNELFANCVSLKLLPDISNWDTCNVINMEKMFYNCRSLSLLPDISNWNTNNVINREKMFYNCLTLTSIPDKFRMDNDINLSDLINNNCISMVFFPEKSKRKIKNTIPSSMIGRYYSMYKLIYEIKKENIINLFDSQFINKNRRNCEIIINNKIHPLLDKYEISDYSQKYLKIKLLILNNKRIDLSYMFNDCESLKKFYLFSQKKNNFKNEEENLMKEEYNDEKAESIITNKENLQINPFYNYDKSNNTFKEISNDKKLIHNNYRNQIHFIYSNKNINSDIEKEKMKEIMKNSGKYLSEISSFDSYEPQNNNINEINSTTETEYPTIKTKINKSNKNNENQTINEILYYF